MNWQGVAASVAGTMVGAGLGAYLALSVITARVTATLESIEQWRIPLLVQVGNRELDMMRERIWRAENDLATLMGREKPPFRKPISWEELKRVREAVDMTEIQLLRDFIEVSENRLHCDPYPEITGK